MRGALYVADCYECARIPPTYDLYRLAVNAVKKAGMRTVDTVFANFPETVHGDAHGDSVITLMVPLDTSHLVIHTWPALRLVCVDLFTCGDVLKAEAAMRELVELFQPQHRQLTCIPRGDGNERG